MLKMTVVSGDAQLIILVRKAMATVSQTASVKTQAGSNVVTIDVWIKLIFLETFSLIIQRPISILQLTTVATESATPGIISVVIMRLAASPMLTARQASFAILFMPSPDARILMNAQLTMDTMRACCTAGIMLSVQTM